LDIVSINEGIQIEMECSDEQCANAVSPKMELREPDSNLTIERCVQSGKQRSDIFSIDEGIQID
jgi:hypothetical protein